MKWVLYIAAPVVHMTALVILYGWFAVPAGAPDLPWYHIAGLYFLARLVVADVETEDDSDRSQKVQAVAWIALSLLFLVVGALLQLGM